MKAIIVDDEYYAMNYLEKLCSNIEDICIKGKFKNAKPALEFIENNDIDIVFMDIEMPGLSGLEAVEKIRDTKSNIGIIFVTGYEQHAFAAFQLDAVAYLLKPCKVQDIEKAIEKAQRLAPEKKKRVEIRTFGQFCVSIDGEPLRFANQKAKELLAILVDRQGASVTIEQAADILWENHPYDETVKQLYRKAVSYLNKTFGEKGLDFFVSNRGSCHILPSKVDCDYFRLMEGDKDAARRYFGEYLNDYSWAENTIGKIEKFLGNI